MVPLLKKKASSSTIGEASIAVVGKTKYPSMSDPKYCWVLGEVHHYASLYSSKRQVDELLSSFQICSESLTDFVSVKHCLNSDRVYMKPPRNDVMGKSFDLAELLNKGVAFKDSTSSGLKDLLLLHPLRITSKLSPPVTQMFPVHPELMMGLYRLLTSYSLSSRREHLD
ncbi:hypothetical protein VNO80_10008 [Phaseolus coccineus]|uniref:Uncharacterized protein n=1 Tax=Phaseolus coccineus TaxID=3886 RepID=A0AAN9NCN0_PHACN